jgi:soluble lytic murein transglycosylase-like protein
MPWLLLLAGAGLLAMARTKPAAPPGGGLLKALPLHARQYAAQLEGAARVHGVDPFLLAAVLEQESDFGAALTPKGPGGKGDRGYGHGVGQIDSRTWGAWLKSAAWWDFGTNATKAAEILAAGLKAFPSNVAAGLAAYNAGPGRVRQALAAGKAPGSVTTHTRGVSYPDSVLVRLARLQSRAS